MAAVQGMDVTRHGDVAVLSMRAGRANSMSAGMLADLSGTIADIRASDAGALVVTGEGRAFSAGLALPELVDLSRRDLDEFMTGFADTMAAVLELPIPTVAAINGHAIAGGCVLALMCDRRVMVAEGARIGLTEVNLGISLPSIVTEPLRYRLPTAAAARIALGGELLVAAEAAGLGLVDEVGPGADLLDSAISMAGSMIRPGVSFAQIKSDLQRPMVGAIKRNGSFQMEAWLDTWYSETAQSELRAAVARLQG